MDEDGSIRGLLVDLKLMGWYLFRDYPHFKDIVLRKLGLLKLKHSQYYPECIKFYSRLNVNGKRVLDMGSDYGASPMYFISRGAEFVLGISSLKQYFTDPRYEHTETVLSGQWMVGLKARVDHLRLNALKSDIEGLEWDYTPEFISGFDDWIIAVHSPVRNEGLFEYIKANGTLIGSQKGSEFGIYKKVVK
jgi:hypothetical protein